MKSLFVSLLFLTSFVNLKAQDVQGMFTLDKYARIEIELPSNSYHDLFQRFQKNDHQLTLRFEAPGVEANENGDKTVFFNFKTTLKYNGETLGTVTRKSMPYSEGEVRLPAEAFDFVHLLSSLDKEKTGYLPEGEYTIWLQAIPVGVVGEIDHLDFYFVLRKRPGRTK